MLRLSSHGTIPDHTDHSKYIDVYLAWFVFNFHFALLYLTSSNIPLLLLDSCLRTIFIEGIATVLVVSRTGAWFDKFGVEDRH
jgi:hypothetical protein